MAVAEGGVTTAKTEYTFDDAGRVLSQKQTIGTEVKTTSYAYDMARRSVTLTLPDGTTRTKVLDERGRLDSVYLDGTMIADFVYNNSAHTGAALGNGIEATYGRDVAGRLTSMAYGKNGLDPILRHDLGWDAAGQLVWAKKIPDAIVDERYGMDKQGQLTEWKLGVLNAANEILAPADSLGWNLDSRGNWTNVYDSKATVDTRTHSGANAVNVRNGVTFVYDAAGNLLNDGVNAYEWTLDGLLAKVTNASGITEYQFDGQRRLIKREQKNAGGTVVDASMYYWSVWQLDQEVRNNIPRTFAYGNYIDDQIAMKTAGSTFYFHRSYNQSTEAVTDASGDLVERYIETNPYGGYVIHDASGDALTVSSIGNRSVFQGAPLTDNVSGMVYLRNRWYSPQLGRFVSRDPAKDGNNWYGFVGNSPLMTIDPMGLAGLGLVPQSWVIDYLKANGYSDLAIRLTMHYFGGTADPFQLTDADIDFLAPDIVMKTLGRLGKDPLAEWAEQQCATCGEKSVNKAFPMGSSVMTKADGKNRSGTLGSYETSLVGKLKCDCDGWSFSGEIELWDWWNFDIQLPWDSNRSIEGQGKVLLMNLAEGEPFPVFGSKRMTMSGKLKRGCSK